MSQITAFTDFLPILQHVIEMECIKMWRLGMITDFTSALTEALFTQAFLNTHHNITKHVTPMCWSLFHRSWKDSYVLLPRLLPRLPFVFGQLVRDWRIALPSLPSKKVNLYFSISARIELSSGFFPEAASLRKYSNRGAFSSNTLSTVVSRSCVW